MNEKYMREVTIKNYPYLTTVMNGDKFGLKENFNWHIDTIMKNLSLYFNEEIKNKATQKIWYDMTKDFLDWQGKKGGDIIMANSAYHATSYAISGIDPFDEKYPLSKCNLNDIQKDIVRTFLARRISGATYYDETLFKEKREILCERHNIGLLKYYKEKLSADREINRVIRVEKKKRLKLTK